MRTFLQVIGTLLALITLSFLILAIWVDDPRWAGTAFFTGVSAIGAFCAAPEFPVYVPHNERCPGC